MNDKERDFKGVWIPKEIWLNPDLTILDKVIYTEIDSLDNENHCTASNEYFAEFCGCSESKVTKTIKKLKDLGMIEIVSFDGRHRKIRVVKNDMPSNKKYDAEPEKIRSNNIDNNIANNKEHTNNKLLVCSTNTDTIKKNLQDTENIQPKKKMNLYSKCISMIDEYCKKIKDIYDVTNVTKIHDLLVQFLNMRLEMKDKPMYANQFKGLLNKLDGVLADSENTGTVEQIIQQSIEKGYASFYPVRNYHKIESHKSQVGFHAEGRDDSWSLSDEDKRKIASGEATIYEEF